MNIILSTSGCGYSPAQILVGVATSIYISISGRGYWLFTWYIDLPCLCRDKSSVVKDHIKNE